MKRWLMVLLCCMAFVAQTFAQRSFQFHSQNYIGLLEGDNGSAFQFNTINGVQRGTWFAGLGTGLDWYLYRSVPLFVSVNKDWKPSGRTFFFSLDAGTNYAWYSRERNNFSDFISSKFSPSLLWGIGIGYKAGLKNKKDALILNLGYSYKQLKEEQVKSTFCINPPCPHLVENYNYKTNRVSLRLGWQF
jgi:hypothetical protein